ncbi:MAG TPA: glucose-6-phosphate isomerase [Flavobacteriales bacterium]|nr:glucose-6-phosphate isomerase [Flavobacteriales bacterium]
MLRPFDIRKSTAHKRLLDLASSVGALHLCDLFAQDSGRLRRMSGTLDGMYMDWSKHRVNGEVMEALFDLAKEADWAGGVKDLYAGKHINQTEDRAVLHMALRGAPGDEFSVNGNSVMGEVLATRKKMLAYADAVRSNPDIKDVINIGIGGSDLGPLMVTKALRNHSKGGPQLHFVSNVDGAHIESVLDGLNPATTLFIVVSKTFTTQETMANADAAKAWIESASLPVSDHFAAVSTNVDAAVDFGVKAEHVFGFQDWVGGRYSLWGPVGLSIACFAGSAAFTELLAGARAMDCHFAEAPARENLPLISGLLGVWYREYLGFNTHVVLPYAQDLDRLPAYLQQADMESNGKYIGRDGQPVKHRTGPVVWGEAGTNGQHAFYQLLHQGTDIHPADIIAIEEPLSAYAEHHTKLLANAVAQAEALMCGRCEDDVREEMRAAGKSNSEIDAIAPHRVFSGNRPSTFILLDALNPKNVGQLIALYEHKIFIQGLLWNVCSYDQWGVELGKVLANDILAGWTEEGCSKLHDASTEFLIQRLKN